MTEATFKWKMNAFERQGRLWIEWETTAPFRAQEGQIRVYNGNSFPQKPDHDVKAHRWDDRPPYVWDTGLPWGTGYHISWAAQDNWRNWVYIIRDITHKHGGLDVPKPE